MNWNTLILNSARHAFNCEINDWNSARKSNSNSNRIRWDSIDSLSQTYRNIVNIVVNWIEFTKKCIASTREQKQNNRMNYPFQYIPVVVIISMVVHDTCPSNAIILQKHKSDNELCSTFSFGKFVEIVKCICGLRIAFVINCWLSTAFCFFIFVSFVAAISDKSYLGR